MCVTWTCVCSARVVVVVDAVNALAEVIAVVVVCDPLCVYRRKEGVGFLPLSLR